MEVEEFFEIYRRLCASLRLVSYASLFSRGRFCIGLPDEFRFVNRPESVFPQQLDEFRDAAFLIRAEMIVDMPAQIILPEIQIVFRAAGDDRVESVESEIFCLGETSS